MSETNRDNIIDLMNENTRLRAEVAAVQLLAQDSIADADRLRELLLEARQGVELIGCSEEGWDQTIALRESLLGKIDAALGGEKKDEA